MEISFISTPPYAALPISNYESVEGTATLLFSCYLERNDMKPKGLIADIEFRKTMHGLSNIISLIIQILFIIFNFYRCNPKENG